MVVKNIAVSVLARIKNQALKEGISNQLGQQLFFQEEFLRKLAKTFNLAIDRLEVFIGPIYTALLTEIPFSGRWVSEEKLWENM